MKTLINKSFAVLLTAAALLFCSVTSFSAGYYIHDPMANPKAAADIIVDPDAVYGYAPNPDSTRMGAFASYDWSDENFVEQMRKEREDYHASMEELYKMIADMRAEGRSVEEIARAVSTRRNEIRMEFYKDDPEGLEKLKESNLKSFGNENGGTPDFFYEKYGSWETVIEKSVSTNAGADAVLGLYDKYYYTYMIADRRTSSTYDEFPDTLRLTSSTYDEFPVLPDVGGNTGLNRDTSMTAPQTGDDMGFFTIAVPVMTILAVMLVASLKNSRKQK